MAIKLFEIEIEIEAVDKNGRLQKGQVPKEYVLKYILAWPIMHLSLCTYISFYFDLEHSYRGTRMENVKGLQEQRNTGIDSQYVTTLQ